MRIGQWIGLLALVLSLYILWQIQQIVLLFFAAVVFATILNRIVGLLQRYHLKRGIAIAITLVFLLILLSGFFFLVVPQIVDQLQQFNRLLPRALDQVRDWFNWLQSTIPGQFLADNRGFENLIQQLQSLGTRLISNIFSFLSNTINVVVGLLLFLVVTIMILIDPPEYRRVFILAFPAFYRRRVDQIMSECESALVGWIRGTLIDMAVIGAFSYISLLVLGVPLPLVNGILAGLLEFIPNLGPTLSVIPPALLALLDAPWKSLAVIGVYIVIQQFESLILVPIVMKHQVSLMPVFTVLAVVVFASFFGFLGLFLAIPLLIITQIWLKNVLVEDVMNSWQHLPALPDRDQVHQEDQAS